MRHDASEQRERKTPPAYVTRELSIAGGLNPYGEPMFRVVWGWNRMVKMTGEWQEWEQLKGTLTDRKTGYQESKIFNRLKSSVVETREVPKYLPANCWHLEKWCPPEEYGTPETWRKHGEEVAQGMTIDTAGEFPHRGEYELCYPLTDDLTSRGQSIPLIGDVVATIVSMIRAGKERTSFAQRRAAIEQREIQKEEGFVRKVESILRDEMNPFAGNDFITVPGAPKASEKKIVTP